MLKLVKAGGKWTQTHTYTTRVDVMVCATCGGHITLRKGDYWDRPDDTGLKCPECSTPYTVGELLK